MQSNKLFAILAAVVALCLLVYASFFVVNPREQALILRFGQIKAVKSEPGLYFKLPFSFLGADKVQYVSNQDMRFDLNDLRIQVRGGKYYLVDAFAIYRISDPGLFRERVSADRTVLVSQLGSLMDSALRRVYGLRDFQAALSSERATMMEDVQESLQTDAAKLGVDIVDVRILRTDLLPEVSNQTYERMRSERLAEAEATRASGREKAEIRRAAADREVVELESAANRDAQILRGEGEAERNSILGEAYGKDPEFFAFYRSLDAYRNALGENSTMVLSPDSEFFEYFKGAGDAVLPTPATATEGQSGESQDAQPMQAN